MCCYLFHVMGIHLYEYVLTTLPRNISKVLNVFFVVLGICKNTEVYVDFCWKKKCLNILMKSHSITIPKVGSPAYTI
jgi:hypothetical protein